jgi:hypothetical protein
MSVAHHRQNPIESISNVYMWHKSFREGREDEYGDERQCAPITKRTGENVAKITELVQSDRRLTRRMIADELAMSKETVRNILVRDLGMRKSAAKLVPRNLTEEQKDRCLTLCMEFAERIQEGIFYRAITGDDVWCYQYDPEAKRQSMERRWKISPSPRSYGCQSQKNI